MWKTSVLALLAVLTAAPLAAQSSNVDLANLRQDVALLVQRMGDLAIRVETLERENAALRKQTAAAGASAATIAQLNDAVADLNKTIRAATAESQRETLQKVAVQMEALARQTNAAVQSVANSRSAAAVTPPSFNDNYPKEGITYTIERGDTLSSIAQKLGANLRDIINANKITDPTKIQVGQTLFIPGAK
ncbi:MAG: LysM peptidoglycan-binding domain-containing protein [Verrucomicrobiota bacterium]